ERALRCRRAAQARERTNGVRERALRRRRKAQARERGNEVSERALRRRRAAQARALLLQQYLRKGGMTFMMIELGRKKRDSIRSLCEGSREVLVRGAVEGTMGRVWVPKLENSSYCLIVTGDFA